MQLTSLLCALGLAPLAGAVSWKYGETAVIDGETFLGGAFWGEEYPDCDGERQSPINIAAWEVDEMCPDNSPSFNIGSCSTKDLKFSTDSHTWKVSLDADSCTDTPSFTLNGATYELLQFHFHSTSEHTVGGSAYDACLHMVHLNVDDPTDYRVIGLLIESTSAAIDEGNVEVNKYWPSIQAFVEAEAAEAAEAADAADGGRKLQVEDELTEYIVTPYDLLPGGFNYWTYLGSLTTPPCSEVVTWMLIEDPILMSEQQILAMRFDINVGNTQADAKGHTNRVVQPLNNRSVSHCTPVTTRKEPSDVTGGCACEGSASGEMCVVDDACEDGGLGCNALGLPNCRFCGFGVYNAC